MGIPDPSDRSTALITGASSGIGEEFAKQLAERGFRVALVARRAERLQALAEKLGGPERAITIAADLAVAEDRDRLVAELEQAGANIEVLVNNAGFGIYKPFVESGREDELEQVRVDVEAVVDLCARYVPQMVERGRGAVINVASVSAFVPSPFNAGYAAAKAHVLHFSEALNSELKGTGVTVTAVCPGPVRTEFQAANDVDFFVARVPKFAVSNPDKVAASALKAAARGKRTVVPGSPLVKAWWAPTRWSPNPLRIAITKQLMKR